MSKPSFQSPLSRMPLHLSPRRSPSPFQHLLRPAPLGSLIADIPNNPAAASSPSSAAAAAADAARRRAPRALTGRYVRSGTGASPRTLEILRKTILERMKMKAMLGDRSHLFFGALNKQGKHGGPNAAKVGGAFPGRR